MQISLLLLMNLSIQPLNGFRLEVQLILLLPCLCRGCFVCMLRAFVSSQLPFTVIILVLNSDAPC